MDGGKGCGCDAVNRRFKSLTIQASSILAGERLALALPVRICWNHRFSSLTSLKDNRLHAPSSSRTPTNQTC